jgi:3-dehydroquinate synthase class II
MQWVVVGILAGALFAGDALAQHKQPNEQPATAAAPDKVPTGEVALGIARIPRAVTADGKPLPAGAYTVRVTAQVAKPDAVGTTETLERWVEFLQRGEVKGREVVSIVPDAESKMVVQDTPPRPGTSKVQMLRGNDYLRVWFNKDGHHFLIHLPPSSM